MLVCIHVNDIIVLSLSARTYLGLTAMVLIHLFWVTCLTMVICMLILCVEKYVYISSILQFHSQAPFRQPIYGAFSLICLHNVWEGVIQCLLFIEHLFSFVLICLWGNYVTISIPFDFIAQRFYVFLLINCYSTLFNVFPRHFPNHKKSIKNGFVATIDRAFTDTGVAATRPDYFLSLSRTIAALWGFQRLRR